MEKDSEKLPVPAFIKRLMPEASEEDLQTAADNFNGVLGVLTRIAARRIKEGKEAIAAGREPEAWSLKLCPDCGRPNSEHV